MVANIRGYTPNYNFKLINFDTPRWHTLEYANWNMVDAMFLQNGTPQVRGGWQNNTLYLIGDRTFDEDTSATYRCLVEHTSAEFGTFAEDRTANPTYWSLQLAGTPVYRAEWMPAVAYVLGDIVEVNEYAYYLCTQGHTSSADFPTDALKWQKVFDATAVVADAEAAAASAFGHANAAAASAADALTSENNAETAESEAEGWADDARAAAGAFRWSFSSSTTAEDPAVGRIAFNSGVPASVTEIYLSSMSSEAGNPDVSAWVTTWDDSTNPLTRGTLQVRKVGAPEEFMIFELVGDIVDNGTWLKLTTTYISHSGSLTNGEPLSVSFIRAGNVGPTGTGGGDMLRANNLNDVASVPSARNNLGLGTAQIPTFSQVLLDAAVTANKHAATKEYVDASPSLYINDTAPAGVQDGSLWWDSDRGTLLVRYNDGSSTQWVDAVAVPGLDTTPLVKKAGDTMSGTLKINAGAASILELHYNDVLSANGQISFVRNNASRWQVLSGGASETGSGNVGSDFHIVRDDDAGIQIDVPLFISRADGRVTLLGNPTAPLHAVPKQYVDAPVDEKSYARRGAAWAEVPRYQRFSLAGSGSFDVQVPASAKIARLNCFITPTSAAQVLLLLQISTSAGVFINTVGSYILYGYSHNTLGGVPTSVINVNGQNTLTGMLPCAALGHLALPIMFEGTINLERLTTTTHQFCAQFNGVTYIEANGVQHTHYYNFITPTSGLRILALRLLAASGDIWNDGSYLNVEWM